MVIGRGKEGEGLTRADVALERLLARVHLHVSVEVRPLFCTVRTLVTGKRPLSRVNADVCRQVALVRGAVCNTHTHTHKRGRCAHG